ncbi:auxin-responsive protein IAA32-like [Primulina huaijiensis]|uniref:auxin-responsive protein IAA32-like n=1 Tax=Primulina huaijiensis TaxID=1492673 RepID=UPI003CC70B8C
MKDNGIKSFLSPLSPRPLTIFYPNFNSASGFQILDSEYACIYSCMDYECTYCVSKEDSKLIDLGLSLGALQPDAGLSNLGRLAPAAPHPHMKRANDLNTHMIMKENLNEESSERTQNKQCWTSYVKVSMDGVIVGRKVCVIGHMDYLSLALQLEDMFGKYTMSVLRLFEVGSQFSLFYKDIDEQWRTICRQRSQQKS